MAKIETKYNIDDIVWWRTRGKSYSGKVTSITMRIDRLFGTRVEYNVLVNYDCTIANQYSYYETVGESEIYKVERGQEKESVME